MHFDILYSVASTRCFGYLVPSIRRLGVVPTRTQGPLRRQAAARVIEEQAMLQFLIGLSIVAFVLAMICWSERFIFDRRPKAVASHIGDLFFYSDAGTIVIGVLLIALVIAAVPLLCIYVFRCIVFGRENAPLYP